MLYNSAAGRARSFRFLASLGFPGLLWAFLGFLLRFFACCEIYGNMAMEGGRCFASLPRFPGGLAERPPGTVWHGRPFARPVENEENKGKRKKWGN